MNIIAHCIDQISSVLQESFHSMEDGQMNLTDLVKNIRHTMRDLSVEMVEDILHKTEESIYQSPKRKRTYTVQRKDDKKTIATLLGDITFERRYYVHRKTGEFSHLLDDFLELTPHQRMDSSVEEAILERASEQSYQQSIDSLEGIGIHSRTTVMNVVHKYSADNAVLPTGPKKQVDYLYVEADEDHVAYQDSKNREMRLVYVHEGYKDTNGAIKRSELKIARRFTGLYEDSGELWADVSNYLEEQYDTTACKQIFLSGDGASWIKKGMDYLPAKTIFVLDPFHTSQAAKRASAGMRDMFPILQNWIQKGHKGYVSDYFSRRLQDTWLSANMRQTLENSRTYLKRNWESIQLQASPHYISCSAEGHVSHWLSARLSSRPLGWSKRGAENIAKLRIYTRNGGSITKLIATKQKEEQRERKIDRLDKRVSRKHSQHYDVIQARIPLLTHSTHSTSRTMMNNIRGM